MVERVWSRQKYFLGRWFYKRFPNSICRLIFFRNVCMSSKSSKGNYQEFWHSHRLHWKRTSGWQNCRSFSLCPLNCARWGFHRSQCYRSQRRTINISREDKQRGNVCWRNRTHIGSNASKIGQLLRVHHGQLVQSPVLPISFQIFPDNPVILFLSKLTGHFQLLPKLLMIGKIHDMPV